MESLHFSLKVLEILHFQSKFIFKLREKRGLAKFLNAEKSEIIYAGNKQLVVAFSPQCLRHLPRNQGHLRPSLISNGGKLDLETASISLAQPRNNGTQGTEEQGNFRNAAIREHGELWKRRNLTLLPQRFNERRKSSGL